MSFQQSTLISNSLLTYSMLCVKIFLKRCYSLLFVAFGRYKNLICLSLALKKLRRMSVVHRITAVWVIRCVPVCFIVRSYQGHFVVVLMLVFFLNTCMLPNWTFTQSRWQLWPVINRLEIFKTDFDNPEGFMTFLFWKQVFQSKQRLHCRQF